ncbi:Cthe_2314 family HEPN domain-containing protein [Algoriphagus aquimarinus]|uniref:Cthe-2314-like HEPN domain-containing protein n=1 Tax=Algoriphagus aquimarinus TaxID=237018 RepID=A0A5C7A9F0_9BACT|nr:Cthe_2314 family HEPN domain-containing protein [Algoriphagus aquimarinus]TXE03073.1 hypothetical protein ESV85_20635 [Algoriphagus aquimarinus]
MENYKYPTREEWLEVSRTFPEMGTFGFSNVKEIGLLLEGEKTAKEVFQLQNLYHWDSVLSTKVWNLRQSYVITLVNFNRGIAQTDQDFKSELKVINLRQFEFYFETTMYYLISARDIIYQIVNLAFIQIRLQEREVTLNKILKNIQDVHLGDLIKSSSIILKDVNELRNSMAHRFPKTANDFRSEISEDGRRYSSFKRKAIDYDKRIENLTTGIEHLHLFYSEIKVELSKQFSLENG